MRPKWEIVGYINVDAGICWLGDPCYILGDDPDRKWDKWGDFCDELHKKPGFKQPEPDVVNGEFVWKEPIMPEGVVPSTATINHKLGHEGCGVVVNTGYGDGSYPVEVKRQDGRIKEVRVKFF